MTANKITGYSYDPIDNTLTITNAFAKKASQLNTAEYKHHEAVSPRQFQSDYCQG